MFACPSGAGRRPAALHHLRHRPAAAGVTEQAQASPDAEQSPAPSAPPINDADSNLAMIRAQSAPNRNHDASPFRDVPQANPVVGARFQVHSQGIPRVNCATLSEPSGGQEFFCTYSGGVVQWRSDGAAKYWIYRSTDRGLNYSWVGRVLDSGAPTYSFSDPIPAQGAVYQLHHAGMPRQGCTRVG